MRQLQSGPDNEFNVWKTTPVGLDGIMQDGIGHDQLGAWFIRDDIAEKIHACEYGEHETEDHILNDLSLMDALMTYLESILSEISFFLKEIEYISFFR